MSLKCSGDMKIFSVNSNYFFVTEKLMSSAYNKWCQHFFTFNLLWIHCLTVVQSYIDIRLVLLEIWSTWLPPEKTTRKKTSFGRIKTPEWHQLRGEGCITSCCNNPASCWYFLTFYSIYHLIIWNRMHLGHEW